MGVCRTCFRKITGTNFILLNHNSQIKAKLSLCVPELVADLVIDPLLCIPCVDALHSAYNFKKRCIQTENYIKSCMQQMCFENNTVAITNIYKQAEDLGLHLDVEPVVPKLRTLVERNVVDDLNDLLDEALRSAKPVKTVKVNNTPRSFETKENLLEEYDCIDLIDEQLCSEEFDNFTEDIDSPTNSLIIKVNNDINSSVLLKEENEEVIPECFVKLIRLPESLVSKLNSKNKTKKRNAVVRRVPKKKLSNENRNPKDKNNLPQYKKIVETGVRAYICGFCEYKTALKIRIEEHIRTHTGEKPYSCSICNFRTARKHYLREHIRRIHGTISKCDTRLFATKSAKNFEAHKKIHKSVHYTSKTGHSSKKPLVSVLYKEKRFSCKFCDFKSAYKYALPRHMTTHTGEKRFSCDNCSYKTNDTQRFKQHNCKHILEQQFKKVHKTE